MKAQQVLSSLIHGKPQANFACLARFLRLFGLADELLLAFPTQLPAKAKIRQLLNLVRAENAILLGRFSLQALAMHPASQLRMIVKVAGDIAMLLIEKERTKNRL